jgi:hypothetical protein
MIRIVIFLAILLVGMPIIWAFLRHAQKHQRISFFGLNPTTRTDNPKKFDRVVRSYRLQLIALPIIAALVAAFMELPI